MADTEWKKSRPPILAGAVALVAGVVGFLILTSPFTWSLTHATRDIADNAPPDLENGKTMFVVGDCSTCHVSQGQDNALLLGGGRTLETAFGMFSMPNISPHPDDGIGGWTLAEFTRAMREGVGPGGLLGDGENLYPAFPYTSYQRMTANDVRDLFAYIQTLEPVDGKAPAHELKFPYNVRRGVGIWRLAFLDGKPTEYRPSDTLPSDPGTGEPPAPLAAAIDHDVLRRGHYLVEGPGHCAECHSPRTFIGTIAQDQRYGGGPNPEGTGYYPNVSTHETGIGFWSRASISNYLRTGISPINKVAGGDMAEVVHNTAQLTEADRMAMAAYLKTVPPVDKPGPGVPEPNYSTEVVMLPPRPRKTVELPTSPESEIVTADTAYVAHTKPFYLEAAAIGTPGKEDGKFLSATRLAVLATDGGKLKVRLDGWQMSGADPVFYAEKGHRILQAVLGDEAIATVQKDASVIDPDTQQEWAPSSLTAWIDTEGLNTSIEPLWNYSTDIYNSSCGTCHALPAVDHFLANQWIGNLNAMKRFTSLADDQYRLLLAYLQNHAKDVGRKAGAG